MVYNDSSVTTVTAVTELCVIVLASTGKWGHFPLALLSELGDLLRQIPWHHLRKQRIWISKYNSLGAAAPKTLQGGTYAKKKP